MNIDIPATIGKVTRKLTKVDRDGRDAWKLTATRIYETDVEDAWDALTNPERIPRWFLPVTGDFQVGGRYQTQGNAGGVIEQCDAPRVLALTWEMHGDVSWVKVTLEPEAAGTRLTLEHTAYVPDAIFDQFGPGGIGVGWDLALMAMGLHFETGEAVDPKEAETWTTSERGRPFVAGTSKAWAQASIAAGTEAGKARASADRVTEFYSPQSPSN